MNATQSMNENKDQVVRGKMWKTAALWDLQHSIKNIYAGFSLEANVHNDFSLVYILSATIFVKFAFLSVQTLIRGLYHVSWGHS